MRVTEAHTSLSHTKTNADFTRFDTRCALNATMTARTRHGHCAEAEVTEPEGRCPRRADPIRSAAGVACGAVRCGTFRDVLNGCRLIVGARRTSGGNQEAAMNELEPLGETNCTGDDRSERVSGDRRSPAALCVSTANRKAPARPSASPTSAETSRTPSTSACSSRAALRGLSSVGLLRPAPSTVAGAGPGLKEG